MPVQQGQVGCPTYPWTAQSANKGKIPEKIQKNWLKNIQLIGM